MSKPLYRYSYDEAKHNNDIYLWRESFKENVKCADAVKKSIAENFDGMHLQKDSATIVCGEYGVDRVNYVLANTIQNLEWDGRFSQSNKDWAKRFFIPKSEQNTAFSISSHPAVLDGFVNQTRQYYNSLGLFDENHCVKNDQSQNYKGRLLVIKAEVLDDEFKTPDYQLFYAKSGFGCDPDSSGQKVFGFFLKDGEIAHFDRTDFAGALSRP